MILNECFFWETFSDAYIQNKLEKSTTWGVDFVQYSVIQEALQLF